MIDDSAARHVSGASCFGVLLRNRASTSCFGVVRRRLASESCGGVLLWNDSTRLRHAVTSRRVWGQTAKCVIDKHPGLCFATPLQSRTKTWLMMHTRLCFVTPLQLRLQRGACPSHQGIHLWQHGGGQGCQKGVDQ
jgi:hypothetical protein